MSNNKITPTFCITGALDKMKRIDAIVMIHNKTNARWVSMVSKNTDYLILGDQPGSKAKKALELNVKIINENEWYDLVNKLNN